jgi:hypothetical protein
VTHCKELGFNARNPCWCPRPLQGREHCDPLTRMATDFGDIVQSKLANMRSSKEQPHSHSTVSSTSNCLWMWHDCSWQFHVICFICNQQYIMGVVISGDILCRDTKVHFATGEDLIYFLLQLSLYCLCTGTHISRSQPTISVSDLISPLKSSHFQNSAILFIRFLVCSTSDQVTMDAFGNHLG